MGGNGGGFAYRPVHRRRRQCACRAWGGGEQSRDAIASARSELKHFQSQGGAGTLPAGRPRQIRSGPAEGGAAGVNSREKTRYFRGQGRRFVGRFVAAESALELRRAANSRSALRLSDRSLDISEGPSCARKRRFWRQKVNS